jgi:hypothetical protein
MDCDAKSGASVVHVMFRDSLNLKRPIIIKWSLVYSTNYNRHVEVNRIPSWTRDSRCETTINNPFRCGLTAILLLLQHSSSCSLVPLPSSSSSSSSGRRRKGSDHDTEAPPSARRCPGPCSREADDRLSRPAHETIPTPAPVLLLRSAAAAGLVPRLPAGSSAA